MDDADCWNITVPGLCGTFNLLKFKAYHPGGFIAGEALMKGGLMRIGIGYDVHKLRRRPLILGGVTIPYERGLLGILMQMFGSCRHGRHLGCFALGIWVSIFRFRSATRMFPV